MGNDQTSRRQFLQTSAAVAGAAMIAPLSGLAQSTAPAVTAAIKRTAIDQVTLGNTGLKLSRLGMGTGAENGRIQKTQGKEFFIKLIRHAYDNGITHFDTCDRYDTMEWMADALKGLPREKLFIQSKISGKPADTLAAIDLERKRLNTDYVDSMLIHSQIEANWTSLDPWKRIMDGFNSAKDKQWIKARGTSCHNLPALTDAVKSDFHDVHLVRVNPQGKYVDGPTGRGYVASETWPVDPVVEQIKKIGATGRGLIGMKLIGNGLFTNPEDREKAVRFAMGMKEIHAVIIGFKTTAEIDEAIERINRALAEV